MIMKIVASPEIDFPILSEELEIVIRIEENSIPEIYWPDGPKPDRHLLLGLVQSVAMAIREKDPELVYFTDSRSIELRRDDEKKVLYPGVVIMRSASARLGVLAPSDPQTSRRIAGYALRYFTGTIRLDVP
jgi:hypothetical protein